MKKFLFTLIILLLITLTLNHAATSVNLAGNNVHSSYIKKCDSETVQLQKSTLLGFPIEVRVEGWNCAGPDSEGSGYTAQIWNHLFWVL